MTINEHIRRLFREHYRLELPLDQRIREASIAVDRLLCDALVDHHTTVPEIMGCNSMAELLDLARLVGDRVLGQLPAGEHEEVRQLLEGVLAKFDQENQGLQEDLKRCPPSHWRSN